MISDNKDFTFKPTLFFNDEIVLQMNIDKLINQMNT